MSRIARLQAWLAGIWAGMIIGVGAISAPSLFAVLEKSQAGQGAGRIFSVEAKVSLALAMVLFVIERRRVRDEAEAKGGGTVGMTTQLLLVLGALFLTVFGQFAIHPMIEAAKQGQATPLSFGALHGISASMFWLKGVLVLVLAWRLTSRT
jgi:Domain of unknown function (DUF4149)